MVIRCALPWLYLLPKIKGTKVESNPPEYPTAKSFFLIAIKSVIIILTEIDIFAITIPFPAGTGARKAKHKA